MNTLLEALQNRAKKPATVHKQAEYRLYYDKTTGDPLFYSMEEHDKDYIVVDQQTFVQSKQDVYIKDGKLHKQVHSVVYKLVPTSKGTPCYANDVSIVDSTSSSFWEKKVKTEEI